MRSFTFPSAVGLAALLMLGGAAGAAAGGFGHGHGGGHGGYHGGGNHHGGHHHGGYGYGGYGPGFAGYGFGYGGYGFANETVGGDYIGAPFTRFPRPSEIVPPAWGYGTYGVPTMTGIRQAPTAPPSVTVIDSPAPAAARRGRTQSRVLSRDDRGNWSNDPASAGSAVGGAQVVTVTVPRG